jgi:hypothetical protein
MTIIVAKSEILQEPIWNFIEKKSFWYHEIVLCNAHAQENEIVRLERQTKEL